MKKLKRMTIIHVALLTVVTHFPHAAETESYTLVSHTTPIPDKKGCDEASYVDNEAEYIENAIEFTIKNQPKNIAVHNKNDELVMLNVDLYTSVEHFTASNKSCCSIEYNFGDFGPPPDWWIRENNFKLIVTIKYIQSLLKNGEEVREVHRSVRYWMDACGSVMRNINRSWETN